jgi:hypothetical protein
MTNLWGDTSLLFHAEELAKVVGLYTNVMPNKLFGSVKFV